MASVYEGLLCICIVYAALIIYRRWRIYARTRQFVLEQRRKAGIPDSDHRPMAVAAADAAARRQAAIEQRIKESDEVFRPQATDAVHSQTNPSKAIFRPKPVPNVVHDTPPQRLPLVEPETFYGPTESAFQLHSTPVAAACKRDADEISEIGRAEPRPTTTRRVRRKVAEVPEVERAETEEAGEKEQAMEEDDIYDERDSMNDDVSYSDESESMDEDEVDGVEEAEEAEEAEEVDAKTSRKRAADTSNDHGPGDEWTDTNGLRWRIGDDRVPRRAVMLVEMRPKYAMPRDAVHPDARVRVPTYIERFLSHEEYEEAKRKKQLSWQHELAHAKGSSPTSFRSDDVEDSLASIVARRSRVHSSRKGVHDLLFSDEMPLQRSLTSDGDESHSNVTLSDTSVDDKASLSSSVYSADSSRRLRLSRAASPARRSASPARLPLMQQRYARTYAPSPLSASPARTALDTEAKRKREERLLSKIRAERRALDTKQDKKE